MKNKSTQDRWIDQMSNRPLWYDRDMWKAGFLGVFVGMLIVIIFRG
jgi:hypothetical protein